MTVELIVAPPAAGKTEACIEKISTTMRGTPLARVWVIVPGRLQTAAFRRRLSHAGGALGVYVGTFRDLYLHILESAGVFVPLASSSLLHRLMQMTVDEEARDGKIPYFSSIYKTPGFIHTLRDIFAELNRALVAPETFLRYSQSGSIAQKELALLFARYQARLHDLGWVDPEGLSRRAVDVLQSRADLQSSIKLLLVDGFDTFTPAQRRALQLLAGQVGEMLVTFPGTLAPTRKAHRRFSRDIKLLLEDLSPRVKTLPEPGAHLPVDVSFIEANIFESGDRQLRVPGAQLLLEARSPYEEAREALRWVKTRVLRNGVSLGDCVIFVPDLGVYQPLLSLAASEFGMPLHFTRGKPLTESPLIAALLNVLSLHAQNYPARQLFAVMRSPYFHFGLEGGTVDALENISRVARVLEGRDQWNETWAQLIHAGEQDTLELDEDYPLGSLPQDAQASTLRDALEGFFSRITFPLQPLAYADWVGRLEDMLDDLGVYDRANSESDRLAAIALRQALRALVLGEAVVGKAVVDYQQFLIDLQGALDGVGLPEPVMYDSASLTVAKMSEAAGVRFKAVVLLGMSEGIFPQVEREDPFLDEKTRLDLGLESRLGREQTGLFYQAVCSADQYLLITRPYLSEDGEAWEASPYWKSVESLFADSCKVCIRPDDPRSLVEAASGQEVLFWAAKKKDLPQDFADLQVRWKAVQEAHQVMRARLAKRPDSPYEGHIQSLVPELARRYSAEKKWSASKLESYAACPYDFFAAESLKLEAVNEPEAGLDARQAGSMLHRILEEAYKTVSNPADVEAVLAVLPGVLQHVFENAPRWYGFRPSYLWEIEKKQYAQDIEKTIIELSIMEQGWTPYRYEQQFGLEKNPPLKVELEDGYVLLRGIIDRLDRDDEGRICVIDYKSGGSHLALQDLKIGRRLQLPLYALAARDALNLGEPVSGFYWQIRGAKAGGLKLGLRPDVEINFEEAVLIVKKHLQRIIGGIRAGNFAPRPPAGGCPPYCPATMWCWRYRQGW